jgi:hypothetical protein
VPEPIHAVQKSIIEFLESCTDDQLMEFVQSPDFVEANGLLIVRKALIAWVACARCCDE